MTGDYERQQAGPQNQNDNEQTRIKVGPIECLPIVARIGKIEEHRPPQAFPPIPRAMTLTGHGTLS